MNPTFAPPYRCPAEVFIPAIRQAAILAFTCLIVSAAAGCGIDNLFATPGPAAVSLTYTGDTVLTLGSTVPLSVVVAAGGIVQTGLRLSATSSDTTVFALTPAADSIIPVSLGRAALTVRVQAGIFTDSQPTLRQSLRVRP